MVWWNYGGGEKGVLGRMTMAGWNGPSSGSPKRVASLRLPEGRDLGRLCEVLESKASKGKRWGFGAWAAQGRENS
jgi:hypothetical protein